MVLVGALPAQSWLAWLGVFAAVLIGSDIARRWRWVATARTRARGLICDNGAVA